MKRYLLIAIFAFFCKGLAAQTKMPEWLKTATFYQVYPQSFKDSDGDGIGDLNGITSKLDYLESLGINAMWINPVFLSPFEDAGYDIIDFYKLAPRYGNFRDLDRLILQSHKRGIKICFDLVAGHTSDKSPWFIESSKKEKNQYTDRYIWTNSKQFKPGPKWIRGNYERDGCFLKNFFDIQPALNYGYARPSPDSSWEQPVTAPGPQSTIAELKNIIQFWMDKGIDGFRVDMASTLIKKDSGFIETSKLWRGVRDWFGNTYPQGALIAEWSDPEKSVKAGFMIDFLMHFNIKSYRTLFFNRWANPYLKRDTCYFSVEGNGTAKKFMDDYTYQIKAVGDNGYISVPTSNHDFARPNCGDRNTSDQLKVVLAFLLTLKGIPFIYYGDEIGMKYIQHAKEIEGSDQRGGSRTPMQWNNSVSAGFSTATLNKFYLPLDTFNKRPSVEQQLNDKNSILNFTKQLIALRKKYNALGNTGGFKLLYCEDYKYPLVYEREFGSEKFLIVINPSGQSRQATFQYHLVKEFVPVMAANIKSVRYKDGNLIINSKKISYGIYMIK